MGKLINRIPGLHLLISSLPGSALRMHVESLEKQSEPGGLSLHLHPYFVYASSKGFGEQIHVDLCSSTMI